MRATALFPPAFSLPQSPAAAVALILVLLAVTYVILNLIAPVRTPEEMDMAREDAQSGATDEPDGTTPGGTTPETTTPDEDETREAAPEPEPPQPPREPDLRVDAIRVRGVPLAVGDTASQVMRAFRPGEGERLPLIERRPDGQAARVIRAYRAGDRLVVLILEREAAEDPLRLTALDIEES